MPPVSEKPIIDSDHLLPSHKTSAGPTIGIVIILLVLIIGAIYFGINQVNQPYNSGNQVPYIPAATTTLPAATTTQ